MTNFVAIETTNPRYVQRGHSLTLRFEPDDYDHAAVLRLGTDDGTSDREACWLTRDSMRQLRDALTTFLGDRP